MLNTIREALLAEARQSPGLLSDLAGLENYVAESYDARSFVELLQNADDAGSSRFKVLRSGDFLLVANDGHCFTLSDFESLCRSAASTKHRGATIGYRGIGFKSVVGFAKAVHVLSGDLEATFSREKTAKAIPQATRVPLIRIPHALDAAERAQFGPAVENLNADGYNTVFVFAGLIASGIEAEFAAFDASSLLFLRNVRGVELRAKVDATITIRREAAELGYRTLRLAGAEGISNWSVFDRNEVALGFVHDDAGIARLPERQAVVHAFLPTHEPTGFPFKLNGDISTDPSRTRIVLDDRTAAVISATAKLIVKLVHECLFESLDVRLMTALVPVSDPRMVLFQRRSFRTELFTALQRESKGVFDDLFCRPPWLNALDFEVLAKAADIKAVPRNFEGIDGLEAFLRFLGAKSAGFLTVAPTLKRTAPSNTGAAEIVAHLTTLYSTRQLEPGEIKPSWKLWQIGNRILSMEEAKLENSALEISFVEKVTEKVSCPEMQRLLAVMTDKAIATRLLPEAKEPNPPGTPSHSPQTFQSLPISLKRWRAAEQQVLSILTARGWKVEDVSRQNIGYDIEGRTPEGEEAYVEVKMIEHTSQPFTLTSNEEAVARQKGKAYRLAIVRQTNNSLEVTFIEDPINKLKLTRQCRQWVWECQAYEFSPERFQLE